MNMLCVLLAFAWPGDAGTLAPPILVAQETVMENHDHASAEHDHEHAHAAESERPLARQSYLVWLYYALGPRYALALFLSGSFAFFGSLLVVVLCKRPGPIATFFPFVTIPLLIGLYGLFDGLIVAFSVTANSTTTPKPAEIAAGIATALYVPFVGLLLTAPSYLILSIGLFARSLLYREPAPSVYDTKTPTNL